MITRLSFKQFINMCRLRQWDEMENFLNLEYPEAYTKILVTAVFQAYGKKRIDLSRWDRKLSTTPGTIGYYLAGKVDIEDFCLAYKLAGNNFNEKITGLEDAVVASLICNYVKMHKSELYYEGIFNKAINAAEKKLEKEVYNAFGFGGREIEAKTDVVKSKASSTIKTKVSDNPYSIVNQMTSAITATHQSGSSCETSLSSAKLGELSGSTPGGAVTAHQNLGSPQKDPKKNKSGSPHFSYPRLG